MSVLILLYFLITFDTASIPYLQKHLIDLQRRIFCEANDAQATWPLTGTCSFQRPTRSSSHVFAELYNFVEFAKYFPCILSRPLSLSILISTLSHFSLHLGSSSETLSCKHFSLGLVIPVQQWQYGKSSRSTFSVHYATSPRVVT